MSKKNIKSKNTSYEKCVHWIYKIFPPIFYWPCHVKNLMPLIQNNFFLALFFNPSSSFYCFPSSPFFPRKSKLLHACQGADNRRELKIFVTQLWNFAVAENFCTWSEIFWQNDQILFFCHVSSSKISSTSNFQIFRWLGWQKIKVVLTTVFMQTYKNW